MTLYPTTLCYRCGAGVLIMDVHIRWHQELDRRMADAFKPTQLVVNPSGPVRRPGPGQPR